MSTKLIGGDEQCRWQPAPQAGQDDPAAHIPRGLQRAALHFPEDVEAARARAQGFPPDVVLDVDVPLAHSFHCNPQVSET